MQKQTPIHQDIIDGITIYYTEFKGLVDVRYEMTFLINNQWKVHTLICTENNREYKMRELINMYKSLTRRD